MSTYYFAWWNVQNLFDVEGAPTRPEWLQSRLRRELKGWTQEVLDRKLDQLAWVINQMNDHQGPDLLGMCEVENDNVLHQLVARMAKPGRDYKVVHHDMSDNRGIDIAFVYDANRISAGQWFSHVVQKRSPTRDILQVNFKTHEGQDFVVLGNHWPSRMGGKAQSEPFRMMAGETLAYFHERIRHYMGNDVPVIVMGDFNDAPHDKSLVDFALSSNSQQRVLRARTPRLYNLMWEHEAAGRGTFVYGSDASCLDQLLVSRGLLDEDSPLTLTDGAEIHIPEGAAKGAYDTPIPFRADASDEDGIGSSDHHPIGLKLIAS